MAVSRSLERLPDESRFFELIAFDNNPDSALEFLCQVVERTLPGTKSAVLILDRSRRRFSRVIAPALGGSYTRELRGVPVGPPHLGTCAAAVFRGEVVVSADISRDDRWLEPFRRLAAAHGLRASRSTPIKSDDETPIGSFIVSFPHTLSDESEGCDVADWAACLAARAIGLELRRQANMLMIRELEHRSKNLITLVDALVDSSFGAASSFVEFKASFSGRVKALVRAHELLRAASGGPSASLRTLLQEELCPYLRHEKQLVLEGPDICLGPQATTCLALVAHELTTNAVKHGCLKEPTGRVEIGSRLLRQQAGAQELVELQWRETGGPPAVNGGKSGFGMSLIKRSVAYELDGRAECVFGSEGFKCTLRIPHYRLLGNSYV